MKLYNTLLAEYKKRQMGYVAIAIIGQSCIGSIAAALILVSDLQKGMLLGQLYLVTMFSMCFNAAVITHQKPKITFNLLLGTVFLSGVAIVLQLI